MQDIDDFLEGLLNDKGITDVDPEIRAELKEDMKTRLTNQIKKAAILELSEEKAIELANQIDRPDFTNEELTKFIQDAGVSLAEVTVDTMLKFRNFYLGSGE